MKASLKIWLPLLAILIYLGLCGVLWLEHLGLQIVCLAVTSLLMLIRFGFKRWIRVIIALLPFLLTLMLVYLAFSLLGIKPLKSSSSASSYWISYGSVRALILLSSLFFIQISYSFTSFSDLMALPVGINTKKYFILGKTLYHTAFSSYSKLSLHISLIPSHQAAPKSWREQFRLKLTYLLALLYLIIRESKIKGELIDNRILHCHDGRD